jgi:LuxR family maltose regulon positive regulatory protein
VGWGAGLRLAALHLRGCADVEAAVESFSGDDHSVAGYLLTEVLDRQPPELIGLLERISIVDLVSAGLANALTDREDGDAVLAELAASHLFVEAVGRPGRWYRLHRLLADVLRARPIPPRLRRDLHRRAAEWFRDHDMPLAAVRSALRGGLWPLAGDLIGTHLVPLAMRGAAHELEQALAGVPRAVLFSRPELATGLAGARVVQGVGTEVSALIASARAGARQLPTARAERVEVLLDLITGAHARLAGDFDAAVAAYRRVPDQPAPLATLGFAGAEIVPVIVHSNLGTAELWIGDLTRGARSLGAAADPGSGAPALSHINAAAYLALLHCERGELDTAVAVAGEVTATAASMGWARTPQAVPAYLAMARVLLDRDELAEIDTWLDRAAEVASVAPEPHVQLATALVLAARREAVGNRERALAGLRATASRLAPWVPPRGLAEQWMVTESELLIRSGDAARARALLDVLGTPRTTAGAVAAARVYLLLGDTPAAEGVLPDGNPDGPRTEVGVHLVRALAALAAGEDGPALDCIEDALLAAAPSALRRPFLAAADELRDLLQRRLERGSAAPTFAIDLLRRMTGEPVDELAARRALVDPLTEREKTILHYLASALSNAEIATELYVSVNTVKTHQRTVYRKLGAAGRRDAVRRARALRLL